MQFQRKPDTSGQEQMENILTFQKDFLRDYTSRCNNLTAHIITPTKANKEVAERMTYLAEEVSTFIE
jgi:hypothetical protein